MLKGMDNTQTSAHIVWSRVADTFRHIGPPMRPSEEDIRAMERFVAQTPAASRREVKALLWGVTPEITAMTWPDGTSLLAVDQSEVMIEGVWLGDIPNYRRVEQGNWLDLPVEAASQDVILGDGCFSLMGYPDGYQTLAASAHRVLNADGRLIIRFFVRPEEDETPDHVLQEVMAGKIGSFHAFKWRLYMAVQQSSSTEVTSDTVWQVWNAQINPVALMRVTGWSPQVLNTINHYENSSERLSFPTLKEVRSVLSGWFEEVDSYMPSYEMGERFPTLALRPLDLARIK